ILKGELNSYVLQRSIIHSIERYHLHKRLKLSREELENFAHTVAHGLKSPIQNITTIIGKMKYYFTNDISFEPTSQLDKAENKLISMADMIEKLLSYCSIDNTKFELFKLNLKECVEESINNLYNIIEENNATIKYGKLPEITGNKTMLIMLMQNLIDNAIKYKKENESLIINIEAEKINDKMWKIGVSDNGIGISKKYQQEIFNFFKRVNSIQKPGFGIGLANSKKIIEKHGGNIWVESEPGVGSTFYFTLPETKIQKIQTESDMNFL
ncbi:MAG: sensor histidine kinase, partial [Spirochaetota bacterium]